MSDWGVQLKDLSKANDEDAPAHSSSLAGIGSDFNLEMGDGALQTMLTTVNISSFDDRRLLVGRTPTANSLTALVGEQIPLNVKQRMVVANVLSEALARTEHPFDSSQRKQMLLCIMGEGGTGKSQVKAIVAGMDLLHHKKM